MGSFRYPARPRDFGHAAWGAAALCKGLGFTSLVMGTCLPQALHAQATIFNGTVALSSQLVDRGQAITGNTPVLQGTASWTFPAEGAASGTFPSGWSLGLGRSTEARSPSRMVVTLVQASRYWSLSGDWQMQVGLLYYSYAGQLGSRAFDRAETGVSWTYRDVLTLSLSAIYVIGATGHQPRGAADIDLHWPLARHFSVSLGAGITQSLAAPYGHCRCGYESSDEDYESPYSRARADHYGYGHLGLSWSDGAWRVELDRIVTAPKAQQQWGNPGTSLWVATLSRSF
jgi:uncharacterized protein (TIGR02001 family)